MFLRSGGQKQYVEKKEKKKKKYVGAKPQSSEMPKTLEAPEGVVETVSGTSGDQTPQMTTSTPRPQTSERVDGIIPGWELAHVDGGDPFLTHDVPIYGAQGPEVSFVMAGIQGQKGPRPDEQEDTFSFLASKVKANLDATDPTVIDTYQPGAGGEAGQTDQAQVPRQDSYEDLVDLHKAGAVAEEAKNRVAKMLKDIQEGLDALTSILGVNSELSDHLFETSKPESRIHRGVKGFSLKLWKPFQSGTTDREYHNILVITTAILRLMEEVREADFKLLEAAWRAEMEQDFAIVGTAIRALKGAVTHRRQHVRAYKSLQLKARALLGFPTAVEDAEAKVLKAKVILAHEITEDEAHQNLEGMAAKLKTVLGLEAGIQEYQLAANHATEVVMHEAIEYSARFKPKYRVPEDPDAEEGEVGQIIADQMLSVGSPAWTLIDNPVFDYDSDPEMTRLYHRFMDARKAGKDADLYPKIQVRDNTYFVDLRSLMNCAKAAGGRFAVIVGGPVYQAVRDKLAQIRGFIQTKETLAKKERVPLESIHRHPQSADSFSTREQGKTLDEAMGDLGLKSCPTHSVPFAQFGGRLYCPACLLRGDSKKNLDSATDDLDPMSGLGFPDGTSLPKRTDTKNFGARPKVPMPSDLHEGTGTAHVRFREPETKPQTMWGSAFQPSELGSQGGGPTTGPFASDIDIPFQNRHARSRTRGTARSRSESRGESNYSSEREGGSSDRSRDHSGGHRSDHRQSQSRPGNSAGSGRVREDRRGGGACGGRGGDDEDSGDDDPDPGQPRNQMEWELDMSASLLAEERTRDNQLDWKQLKNKVRIITTTLKAKGKEGCALFRELGLDSVVDALRARTVTCEGLQNDPAIEGLSESDVLRLKRLTDEISVLKDKADAILLDPDTFHPSVRKAVAELRQQSRDTLKIKDILDALHSAKEMYRRRLQQDHQNVARETIKNLSFSAVKKFDPAKNQFLRWMMQFLEDTRGIDSNTLKLKKLREGVSKDWEKTLLLRKFEGDQFLQAVRELNDKFADKRVAWVELSKRMHKCKELAVNLDDVRQIIVYSTSIREDVMKIPGLGEYMTEQWWLASVYKKLPERTREQFVIDKAAFERLNPSKASSNIAYFFDFWCVGRDALLRQQHSMDVGANLDYFNTNPRRSKQVTKTSLERKLGSKEVKAKTKPFGKKPKANDKARKPCLVCKKADCYGRADGSGAVCSFVRKAGREGNSTEKRKAFDKVTAAGLCPACFKTFGKGHKCSAKKTDRFGKTIDLTKFRCSQKACEHTKEGVTVAINRFICRCTKAPNAKGAQTSQTKGPGRFKKKWRKAAITRIVTMVKTHQGGDWDDGLIDGLVNICPEEFCTAVSPQGEEIPVLVSYDSACDSELANKRTVDELGHEKSIIRYNLVTATGIGKQREIQGEILFQQYDGSTISKSFASVKSEPGGVLEKQTLVPVHAPPGTEDVFDKEARHGYSPYHVILGTGSLNLHPDEILWASEDGNSKILRSKISGGPVLIGKFPEKEESVFYSENESEDDFSDEEDSGSVEDEFCPQLCSTNATNATGPGLGPQLGATGESSSPAIAENSGEISVVDLVEGTTERPQVGPDLLSDPYVVPGQTCRPPPPFGASNSNLGLTDNYSSREMFPAGTGFDVGPFSDRFWYPRVAGDVVSTNATGDNVTFFLKRGGPGDIKSILKKASGDRDETQEDRETGRSVSFGNINSLEIPKEGKRFPVELFVEKRKGWREIKARLSPGARTPSGMPEAGNLSKALKAKKVNARMGRKVFSIKPFFEPPGKHVSDDVRSCAAVGFKLFQEKSSLAKLSHKDRLDYLKEDPLSIAEIPPTLCASCKNCPCNRHPQNFLKNEILKEELNDNLTFNEEVKRWQVEYVHNDLMERFPDEAGRFPARKRFEKMRERAVRSGKWPQIVAKFQQEVKNGNIISIEKARKMFPGFDNLQKAFMAVDYALKSEDPENPQSRCKIRLVGDQSLSFKVGDEKLSVNLAHEQGDSQTAPLARVLDVFMNSPRVVIGDIKSAFFSIDNHPKVCSLSRFFFSPDESPDGVLKEFVQRSVTMGSSMSSNVLSSCIRRSLENPGARETDLEILTENIYCDDVVIHGMEWKECLTRSIDLFRALQNHGFHIPEFLLGGVGCVKFKSEEDRCSVVEEATELAERIEAWELAVAKPLPQGKVPPCVPGVDHTPRTLSVLGIGYLLLEDQVFIKTNYLVASKRTRGLRQGVKLVKGKVLDGLQGSGLTRKGFASLQGSAFDPLGWAAPVSLRWKLIQRRILTKLGKDGWPWTAPVPSEFFPEIAEVIEDMIGVSEQKMQRYRGPANVANHDLVLVSQGDAGDLLTATGQWLVFVPKAGKTTKRKEQNTVVLLQARSKILGIHSAASVPSMELLAAQLAVKFAKYYAEGVQRLFGKPVEVILTTDSTVVLALIRNPDTHFGLKVNYLRRVLELQVSSELGAWFHVPGPLNGIDLATKVHDDVLNLLVSDQWKKAVFLHKNRASWPLVPNSKALSVEPLEDILKRNPDLFTDNCGQKGKRSGLELVRKAKGKSKKIGKPAEKNSKVLAMTQAKARKVSSVKPAKILAATLADEAGDAEDEDGETLPELGYFEAPGFEVKGLMGKFMKCEFLAHALKQTGNFDSLLTGTARAICKFLQASKRPEWAKATEHLLSVKFQLFSKLIQCLAGPTKDYVRRYKNVRSRSFEHEKMFYTTPRLTQDQMRSNEQVILVHGSALSLAVARTLHNKHHLRSVATHERMYGALYHTRGIGRYFEKLADTCTVCKILKTPVRFRQPPLGPAIREALGCAEFQGPGSDVGADYFGPFKVKNHRGSASYNIWGVVFCDYFSRGLDCYPTSTYSTEGFRNAVIQLGTHRGFPRKLFIDAGSQLQKFAAAVGSRKKDLIKGRLQFAQEAGREVSDDEVKEISEAFQLPIEERAARFGKFNLGRDDEMVDEIRSIGSAFNIQVITSPPHHHSENPMAELGVKLLKRELTQMINGFGLGTTQLMTFEQVQTLFTQAAGRANARPFSVSVADGSVNALSPAHLLLSHTYHNDAEFQEVMAQRVMQQDFAGAADKIRQRVALMGEQGHLLFQKYLLSLREKWTESSNQELKPGDLVFLLDSYRGFLTRHKMGLVFVIFQSKDRVDRHALVQVCLRTAGGHARNPSYRKAFLSRAVSSLSVPILRHEDRAKLESRFYDLTEFYSEYGKFIELPEHEQNQLFDESEIYKTHPNTEESPPDGFIKPAEDDWVPFDPTWTVGKELPESALELAFGEEKGGEEHGVLGDVQDDDDRPVVGKLPESAESELEATDEGPFPAPAIGGRTGLKASGFPVYKGKILNQEFYPKIGEMIQCRLYDNQFFTQARVVSVPTRYLKRGYFYANVKLVEGAVSAKKADLSVHCFPSATNWSLGKAKQPRKPRSSAEADIETNPGPGPLLLVVLALLGNGSCKTISGRSESRKLVSLARWKRATLAAIENTNNLYFNGNIEVNLVKYSSQVVTSNNYLGQYDSRALGNVGVLNDAYSPSVDETLGSRDRRCQLYQGSLCVLSDNAKAAPLSIKQLANLTGHDGLLPGAGPTRGSFNDDDDANAFQTAWELPETAPTRYLNLSEPALPWVEELGRKVSTLELEPCKKSLDFSNNVKKIHDFLARYGELLKTFVSQPVSPQGFLPSHDIEDQWARKAVFKLGDVFWSMAQKQGERLQDFSLKDHDESSYNDVAQACHWRGGWLPEFKTQLEEQDLKELCAPERLNCGFLLLKLPVIGRNLHWGSGRPALIEFPDAFRQEHFPSNDSVKLAKWNRDPFVIISFSPNMKEQYFLAYKGPEDVRFPSADQVRTLCVMPKDHPQSVTVSLILQYHDDLMKRTLMDYKPYRLKYDNVQQSIRQFNELDGQEESDEDARQRLQLKAIERRKRSPSETEDCTESSLALIDEGTFKADILRELRLTPDQLHRLIDETRVYFSENSRDFFSSFQSEIRSKELRAASALNKIRKLIPNYLKVCRKWYAAIDRLFTDIPESLNDIDLGIEKNQVLFSDSFEMEALVTAVASLSLSFVFNLLLLAFMTHQRRKARIENTEEDTNDAGEEVPMMEAGADVRAGAFRTGRAEAFKATAPPGLSAPDARRSAIGFSSSSRPALLGRHF